MYRLLCACVVALLSQQAGTNFRVLMVGRPEITGCGCSALLHLRTEPTYPGFVMASPVAVTPWVPEDGQRGPAQRVGRETTPREGRVLSMFMGPRHLGVLVTEVLHLLGTSPVEKCASSLPNQPSGLS